MEPGAQVGVGLRNEQVVNVHRRGLRLWTARCRAAKMAICEPLVAGPIFDGNLRPVPKLIITKGLRENLLLHQLSLDNNLPSWVDWLRLRG
jgi:hypothetical protein